MIPRLEVVFSSFCFRMKLILKIVTVGNGVGVVIPKDVLAKLNLEKGQRISIEIEEVK